MNTFSNRSSSTGKMCWNDFLSKVESFVELLTVFGSCHTWRQKNKEIKTLITQLKHTNQASGTDLLLAESEHVASGGSHLLVKNERRER